ncbi:uncharacterized protein ABDE67_002310 [Symphorus nematophorus]
MSTQPTQNHHEGDYRSLMRGLRELDFQGPCVPSDLVLIGDHAFPLAMNSQGQVLMAASLYGRGRIVVLGHEGYLTTFPALVENALTWLRGDGSDTLSVGVHQKVRALADNLSKSSFQAKVVGGFDNNLGVGVYVTDAYSVGADPKDLVAFMKAGGGVLIAGQAWSWAADHPKENTLLVFVGNKVSGVAGIYFSERVGEVECLPVYPQIPSSWMAVVIGKDFEDDLQFLLQGVSEFDLRGEAVPSEVLVHGPLAFPIGTTDDGRPFLAGAYYGQGRVIVITHEGLLRRETLAPVWINALRWLDEGRNGVVGVVPDYALKVLSKSGLRCERTNFRKDLSVFVCTAYSNDHVEEIQDFVAEGGGLLIGGHAWWWAHTHPGQNPCTDFSGNKILNKMGLTLLKDTISAGLYKAPVPSQAIKDTYHFRHLLHRFAGHVTQGKKLSKHEEECLQRLGKDCAAYLNMRAHDYSFYTQVVSTLTEILKKTGMPQVCDSCPVTSPKDHLLLSVGAEVYKVCPDPDALLPYLIKHNPLMPVVYNHRIKINANTAGEEEWLSTGLYLSPGMKTYMTIPAEIINKGWQIQIGCQTDYLNHSELKRAPCVHERFPVTSEMMQVWNLWGGLIYLVAPANTKVEGPEVIVQMAVPAPYYKSGVTTAADWSLLRTAPSPWAELEFDNIILTVPSDFVQNLERPDELAKLWNDMMKGIADLAAKPHRFPRKERIVADVQISCGWMHSGYPIMTHTVSAGEMVSVDHAKSNGLWGPIHELGHNQQRGCWEFPSHTTECTCNLWSVYVHEEVLGIDRGKAHPNMTLAERNSRTKQYVKGGRNLNSWSMWVALETYMQLQDKFGWDAFKKVFATYLKMSNFPGDNEGKMNLYAEIFSQTVEMNLAGFFKAWGWPIKTATEEKLSNLPPWSDHPMVQYDFFLTMSTQNHHEGAYMSLMRGLRELDFRGPCVPGDLVLIGDHAFPLAMNSQGQVLMAASLYGRGRIVVLGHEGYLTTFPALVENALTWLRGDGSDTLSVGVHQKVRALADNLSKSSFQAKVVGGFDNNLGVGVYVTDAYSVGADPKDLVAFMKAGGGVLIAGQAWSWAADHPKENTLLVFEGNKVSGVAGIYFSEHQSEVECLPVYPQIPSSWMAVVIGKDFEDDYEFLLQGISDFDLERGVVASEIMVHGPLAFPIGTTEDGRAFLAGSYYGQGRVIVITHEGLLRRETLAPFWSNALHWLDEGRNGVIGVVPGLDGAIEVLSHSGLKCERTDFREDLSVYVCMSYSDAHAEEIQNFVAEGGGLLVGGHGWYWAQTHPGQDPMTDFAGNKILNKMGLSLLGNIIGEGLYKAPVPSQVKKDTYHFRHLLHRFAGHVTQGEELTAREEEFLRKLGGDCANYLHMKAHDCTSYAQVVSSLTDIIKKTGMPQVCDSCPVKNPKDHLLLSMGAELYKVCPDPDALLPYLIKHNPLMPVVYNHRIKIDLNTEWDVWLSTGLYLSPGMKTYMAIPAEIVNKGWQIQIGCQTDYLNHSELKRAPCVHERFPVTSEMMQVWNLWGGLIYLVAPANTKVEGPEVIVQMAVPAPYYKSGVTTAADWSLLRTAPSPWAELEFDNIIITVPSEFVRDLERPDELAKLWNAMMRGIANLAAKPHKFPRKERFVADVQISHGWMHAGYPIMSHKSSVSELVNADVIRNNGLWGPIHELGHNQQRGCWEFPSHTTECTCNLWSVYVHEEVLGIDRGKAHPNMTIEARNCRAEEYAKGGRNLNNWSMWVALETYMQLQDKFGWDSFKKVFATYLEMSNFPNDNPGKMNLYAEIFSQTVEMNLAGFFKAWGWPIETATEEKLSNLPPWSDHPMAQYD